VDGGENRRKSKEILEIRFALCASDLQRGDYANKQIIKKSVKEIENTKYIRKAEFNRIKVGKFQEKKKKNRERECLRQET